MTDSIIMGIIFVWGTVAVAAYVYLSRRVSMAKFIEGIWCVLGGMCFQCYPDYLGQTDFSMLGKCFSFSVATFSVAVSSMLGSGPRAMFYTSKPSIFLINDNEFLPIKMTVSSYKIPVCLN